MTRSRRIIQDGLTAFALLALIALFALKMNRQPESIVSESFYVIDGDTLSLAGDRFRLLGIDAPESRQQCERNGQPWACGTAASDMLGSLVHGARVECRGGARDRYDRLLVTCFAGAVDLNAAMVRQGMAIASGGYVAEEDQARRLRVGLWSGTFERPRDFRREEQAGNAARKDPLARVGAFLKRLAAGLF